jgi:hypothetical protein
MSVKPLGDANPSFTLEAKARDCPPLQFVREFTVNALEAIEERAREGDRHHGPKQVVWRAFQELGDRVPAPKLACIDTGIGMTADELERYVNALSSTSKKQGLDANYGMGAKIAGAVGNPAGLTYLSWTGSPEDGYGCTMAHDPDSNKWGLVEDPDTLDTVLSVEPQLCPREIRAAGWRGTAVVFHGTDPLADTTRPPTDEFGVDWIERAINTRFYVLPQGVDIRCQRPGGRHLRQAFGQRALLDQHTLHRGKHRLSDATVHWRILDTDHEGRRKQNGRWAATGHRAALYDGELYELRTQTSGGFRKLQEFGIVLGYARVVLYVEPDAALPDTVRAHLVVDADGETKDLPWERWGDEFARRLPPRLRELVERAASQDAKRDRRQIMRRLQELAEALPIPRYLASATGTEQVTPPTHGSRGGKGGADSEETDEPGKRPGQTHGGDVVSLFKRSDGPHAERSDLPTIPEIKPEWVTETDGTRVPPMLEDRGATFLRRESIVQLNADFRGYQALLKYLRTRHADVPGGAALVEAETRIACENLIIEFIVGLLRLRSAPHWTTEAEDHVLDDRALTGCLMQHATLVAAISERLHRKVRRAA